MAQLPKINTVPAMTIAENLALGVEPTRFGALDRKRMHRDAQAKLSLIGLNIDPGEPVTVVIDPHERRVDVIFVVPITERPEVYPQGEAIAARWLTLDDLGTVDISTAQAFGALAHVRAGGAGPGLVLDHG